jgi:multidrug efflux pump subunit AcrB
VNLTRPALGNPVAVIVAVLLVLLFGVISLLRMPVQMIPNVERPLIEISTTWRAAAPEEVEAEIVEPQEDALRGLPGLEQMESTASRGRGSITLTFDVNTPLERALIEVMNRLNRVPSYPLDVDQPVVYAGRGRFGSAIAWFAIRRCPATTATSRATRTSSRKSSSRASSASPGIANSDLYGGRNRELRITFDPYRAAALGHRRADPRAHDGGNTDVSGGFKDVGRRQYTIRFSGKYDLERCATWC